MKRLRLLPILIGLLFAAVPLRAQQADFRPDYGVLNGRRYMNGYFGFSYRFPEAWTGSALRYPAVGESKMYPLFSANPQSASTSDVRYVSINADYLAPNTTIKSPKDFLEVALNAQAGPGGEFEALHTDKRYVFGGKQFYRVDMRSKPAPGTPVFYQTLICTILRGYAISFSFMAANNDDMEDLVRTMESLSFIEPGQVAGAQNMITAQQPATPAVTTAAPAAARAPSTVLPATARNQADEVSAQPQAIQSAATSETTPTPAYSSPAAKAAPPPKNPARKSTATVSGAASEVPTAEVPLNQVASTFPTTITVEEAAPAPSSGVTTTSAAPATLISATTASPAASSPAAMTASSDAASTSSRATAPSTVIPMGRAPQRTYPTAEAAPKIEPRAPGTETMRPAAAVPTAATMSSAAAPAPAVLTQPVERTVNSAPIPNVEPAVQRPTNQSVPSMPPENTRVEPKAEAPPTVAAANTSPLPSSSTRVPPMRVHVPPAELEQYITRKTQPVYPMIAKAAGVQGVVVLDIIVDGKGNLQAVSTITGSALLARAAEDALRQWRFKPYLVDGNPVEMESQIAMNFRMTR